MSLQLAAQHLSHQGRGPDDTLVHMSKNELKSLNDLAMAHGGHLTINPHTGLPEAGFLDKLLPTIIGAGISYFTGISPAMVGLGVGAFETVRSGSLEKGLMAGLGAYGGAGLTAGLMGAGEAAIGAEANAALAQNAAHTSEAAFGSQGFGNPALQNPAVAGASNFDKLSEGVSQLFKDPSKVMDSMGGGFNTIRNIGSAAAPLLGAEEVKANMPKTTTQPGKIRTYSYNPYGQTYTSTGDYEVPVTAADGGLMGMYDDYNSNQLNFTQRSEPVVRMADGGTPPQTVEDLYTTILGRAPDAGGKEYWQQRFGDTVDANELAEFKQGAAPELQRMADAAPKSISDLYQQVLGRAPDTGGAEYWQQQFGDTIDANEVATFKQGAAPELQSTLPDQVGNIYRNALGRDPDPGSLQYWTNYAKQTGAGVNDLYNTILSGAKENKELINPNATYPKAIANYTGYKSSDSNQNADEWIRNVLGREVTDADRQQQWYKDATSASANNINNIGNIYGQFKNYATSVAADTTAEKIAQARRTLATNGLTDADVYARTGKTIEQLVGAPKTDLDLMHASQLAPLNPFNFGSLRGGVSTTGGGRTTDTYTGGVTTTPATYRPEGATNPYGNYINPGDITINPDGSRTVTPNIPGRPYGGFTGMGQVRDAYTAGGGRLGYVPYAPSTIEEFDRLYNKQTGGSKQAYDYLTGKAEYSAIPYTKTGEIMKPYVESVMGVPENIAAKKVLFDPTTKKYKNNPDYVPITYSNKGEKVYGLSENEIRKRSTAGEDFAKESGVTYEQIAKALNISIDEAKKRYPALGQSTAAATEVAPEPFVYTGVGPGYRGINRAAGGSISDAGYNLGGYSDGGRLLRGPGDGVSDSIPAVIGKKQPARLADGEFVVPARIVSELGNGSTEAGARKLYAMMDRIQKARGKTVGKGKVAKNSRSEKYLPA